jgi:hypothetical protein
MKIELELHRYGNALLLESQDIYNYIGESTDSEIRLAHYIDKWCQYLNYYISGLHNTEMAFGDTEYEGLRQWIAGYNYAKQIDVSYEKGAVHIKHGKYKITLSKPFEF